MIYAAMASAGAVAGCLGDDDDDAPVDDDDDVGDDDDDVDDDDDDTVVDDDDDDDDDDRDPTVRSDTPLRHAWTRGLMSEANLNPHAANFNHELSWPVMARMGGEGRMTGEWVHLDIEWWELHEDENEFHIKIKDDVYWNQDGEILDPVTAEDWKMQEEMTQVLMMEDGEELIEDEMIVGWDVTGPDDKVLVEHLNPDGFNDALVENFGRFWRRDIHHYRDGWLREHYEALLDATEEGRVELREDLININKFLTDDPGPALSGPYEFVGETPQRAEFRRIEEHWSTEEVNFDEFHLVHFTPEGDPDYQAAVEDQVDMGFGVPDIVDSPPDHINWIASPAGANFGSNLSISWGPEIHEWLQPEDGVGTQRSALIRQAFAHAIDYETVVLNWQGERTGEFLAPSEKPLPGNHLEIQERFPDLWDAVPSTVAPDPDTAEDKLERAGLEFDGDLWVTPDGDPLTIEFASFSWTREFMDTVVGHLQNVGIDAEHRTTEDSVKFSILGTGEFQVGQAWMFFDDPASLASSVWLKDHWPYLHPPEEFEIPPIGEYDAEPTETINPAEMSVDFETQPEETHEDATEKLLWASAYHLPMIPIAPDPSVLSVNTNHFEWPEPRPDEQFAAVSEDDNPIWSMTQVWRELRRGMPGQWAKE